MSESVLGESGDMFEQFIIRGKRVVPRQLCASGRWTAVTTSVLQRICGSQQTCPYKQCHRSLARIEEVELPVSQKQNSNLTDEFKALMGDVEAEIAWGSEAFNKKPDAVNFWMGDERAITSMHRDHYENLYCVVSGWKKFILIPPTDLPLVPYDIFEVGTFKEVDAGKFVIEDSSDDCDKVPCVAIDPLNPDYTSYPSYKTVKPIEVTVRAGQMLYLPSLWFHHICQSHGCIAVNYWYDMEFDIKYNYYKCIESLVDIVK